MSVDPETLSVYEDRAAEYARSFGTDKPGPALARFIAALPRSGKVLDIGCGPGGAAALMAGAGLRVTCLDASPAMVDLARARGLDARCASFDDIAGDQLYHGAWANFSLLHAARADLPRHLTAIAKVLKPRGVFHIGMKLGTGTARDRLGRRYTYVGARELADLLTAAGLQPDHEREFTETGLAGTADRGIIVQGRRADG